MDERESARLEIKIWNPNNSLTDKEVDQFLVLARYLKVFHFLGQISSLYHIK